MFWALLSAGIVLAVIFGYISAWWLLLAVGPLMVWGILVLAAAIAVGMGTRH